jgi:hypothetical protein
LRIHLITGGKGGVGKTLVALCAAVYYLEQGVKLLVADLNFFNSDLACILGPLATEQPQLKGRFNVMPIRRSGRALMVSPNPDVRDHYALPDGIAGFYRDYLNRILATETIGSFAPQVCVVDTGFHPANLVPPMDTAALETWRWDRLHQPNLLKDNALYLWFVWGLPPLLREAQASIITDLADSLPLVRIGHFDQLGQFIHVINPHSLLPAQNAISRVLRLEQIDRLAAADPQDEVGIGFFTDTIAKALAEYKGNVYARETYARKVAETILTRTGGRPKNVVAIPRDETLFGYIESFSYNPSTDLEDVKRRLGKTYRTLRRQM